MIIFYLALIFSTFATIGVLFLFVLDYQNKRDMREHIKAAKLRAAARALAAARVVEREPRNEFDALRAMVEGI